MRVLSIAATLLILLSTTAMADMDDLLSLDIEDLLNVKVYTPTRSEQRLLKAPAKITVITKKQIEERNYITLLDLLEDLPDVDVHRYSSEEEKSTIAIRGNSGSNKFIIMIDGRKISSPTSEKIPIEENFPLFMASQVEILSGPASALYGADAFAGVINIVTNRTYGEGNKAGLIGGTSGYGFGYIQGSLKIDDHRGIAISASYHKANNPDLSAKYGSSFAKSDKTAFGTTVIPTAQTSDRYEGDTTSHTVQVDADISSTIAIGFRQSYYKSLTSNGVQMSSAIFGEDARWETQMRNLYIENRVDVTDFIHSNTYISYSTYEVLPASGYQNLFTNFERKYKYGKDADIKVEQSLDILISDIHDVAIGVSYEEITTTPKTADLNQPYDPNGIFKPGFFYIGSNGTIPMSIEEITYQNKAAYLQLQSEWSELISTTFGIRHDENSRYGSSSNMRGGLVITPQMQASVKILYGESFLAPSPKLTYGEFGSFSETAAGSGVYESSFFHIINPDLKPEKAKYLEMEITGKLSKALTYSLSGYTTSVKDVILPTTFSNVAFKGANLITAEMNVNKGTAQINGGTLSAIYSGRAYGGSFSLSAGYSLTDGWIDEKSGNKIELPYIAKDKFKASLTLRYGNLSITPRIHVIGKQNHASQDPFNLSKRRKVDGYTVGHMNIRLNNLFDYFSIYMDIRNISDVKYYNAGGASAPTASFISSPQDPRKIFIGVEAKF